MLNFFKGSKNKNKKTIAKLYVAPHFSVQDLQTPLTTHFEATSISDATIKEVHNGFTLDYAKATDEKKELITATRLHLLQNETVIYVTAETLEINASTYEEQKEAANFELQTQAFFKHLQEHLLHLQNDELYALENSENIAFIPSLDLTTKNYIFHQLQSKEYVLAILGISELDSIIEKNQYSKDTLWHLVITSKRTLIIGKVSDIEMITLDISSESFRIEAKTGKDKVITDSVLFYTEFMNDSLYHELLPVLNNIENRLENFGDVLIKKYNKKQIHLALASHLYQLQSTTANLVSNELKSDLILHLNRLKITEEQAEAITEVFIKHIRKHERFGESLAHIVNDWQLSYKTQKSILTLLQPFQKRETAKHTIQFHRHFYQLFSAKEKKEEVIFEFNFNYAKHLTNATKYEEAIALYRIIYETLPDDSITDLLPTNTTNLLEGEGGQQLKITILEAILELQKKLGANCVETVHKLAELQPLKQTRIEALKTHKAYEKKAQIIQEVLQAKTLTTTTIEHANKYARLDKKDVLKEVVPSCFKNAKGFFDSLNNFIAALNPPDYDAVISFSDSLNMHNYPKLMEHIAAICYALQIDVPECYIGRGAYATSVIGVEGKPSFLLIGVDFLDKENERYVEENALVFLIVIELAHMYFEHSKITSTDVWRGAADKGFTVVSMLLTVLPFVGNIGKIFGNIASVEKYGKIINRVEQVANVAEKGQGMIEVGEKFNLNLFNKEKSQANESQNLLITSRLMEIVADKVALLFCNDLKAAVKGLLVSKNSFKQEQHIISQYGVEAFLARTNEGGEFVYQELIIRIKSMCAFYLSDTFEELQKQLYANK